MPVISARNVQASPSYNFWQSFRAHALKADPQSVFYVLVPRLCEHTRWKDGADWSGPRTHVVPVMMAEQQFDDLALVTREFYDRFNERFGDLYFDVILTERPMTVPMLRKLVQHPLRSRTRHPLIVVRDQLTLGTDHFQIDPIEELMQAAGWAEAPTIFQSPHQARRALRVARKHLTATHLSRIAERSMVFPLGIDCDDVDATNAVERTQKYDQLTVNYSHKLFLEQKFIESLTIMDSVLAGGRDVRLQVVTGSAPGKIHMLGAARKFKYMEIYGNQNRAQFLRQIAKAHVFISNSYWEDFSATVAEQIYTGLIPVLADEEWSRYLVGEEYPYLFGDMMEGQAMLRYVLDHYEEVRDRWVPVLQGRCREMFDLKRIIPEMVQWLTGLHEARIAELRVSPALVKVVEDAYERLPDRFDLPSFYKAVNGASDSGRILSVGSESHGTSQWLCVDVLRRLHPEMVDTGEEQVVFVKAGG